MNAAPREIAFELWNLTHEFRVFILRAKPHDPFHTGTVVPRSIEHHDFAGGWQVPYVALEIPLPPFDFVRFIECYDARTARIQMLHEALDRAPFARGITPLKQDHQLLRALFHPCLQL